MTRTTALERLEQRAVALQPVRRSGHPRGAVRFAVEPFVVTDAEMALAEQLVLEAEELAALHREVAPPQQAHRLAPGGAVERLGDRCPPVDHDRVAVLVGDGEPADVEALDRVGPFRMAVDAAEHECGTAEVELGQPVDQGFVEDITFVARLERPADADARLREVTKLPRVGSAALQAVVRVIDVRLLCRQIGVLLGHASCRPLPVNRRSASIRGLATLSGVSRSLGTNIRSMILARRSAVIPRSDPPAAG